MAQGQVESNRNDNNIKMELDLMSNKTAFGWKLAGNEDYLALAALGVCWRKNIRTAVLARQYAIIIIKGAHLNDLAL